MKHVFVILAYKESDFLEACIKSVLEQKAEAVIFTTTPNEFIEGLAKKYNLKLYTGEHTSIGGDFDAALNLGKKMGAELVTIAHQDDFYGPNYAEEIQKAFIKNKNTQIIFTDYYEIKNNKKEYTNKNLRIKRILLKPLSLPGLASKKWAKRFALKFGDAICCPAVTFNVPKVGLPLFECHMRCDVDWYAWEKLSKEKGKFVYVKKALMGHRIHEGSETTKTIQDDRRYEEDLEMFKKFWPENIAKQIAKFYKGSEKNNRI